MLGTFCFCELAFNRHVSHVALKDNSQKQNVPSSPINVTEDCG